MTVSASAPRAAWTRLATWWTILRVSLEERLVYRGDFAIATLMRFLPLVTQIFLFWAVFDTVRPDPAEGGASRGAGEIVGYSYFDTIAYLLLVNIGRAFSSMPGLTGGISAQVRSGEIKKFLIQPVDMIGMLMVQRVAHKLVYYLIAIGPFALVFFLARGYFVEGWPQPAVFGVFLVSLVLGFLLGFFMEICLGLVSFWFLEVASLTFIYMLLSFVLSGHMFPLDWFPGEGLWSLRGIVDLLPFKYLAYWPAAVFLGKVPADQMYRDLAIEAVWVVGFFILARVLWRRGVRHYSGFGG